MSLHDLLLYDPLKDALLIRGDLNAEIGQPADGEGKIIGRFSIGERSANFYLLNDLVVVTSTTFRKKRHTLHTWTSNDHKTRNKIDHIVISRRWRYSLKNIDNIPKFKSDSDHRPVVSTIQLKLKSYTNSYASSRMTSPTSARTKTPPHTNELLDTAETKEYVDAMWRQMKDIIHSAAAKTIVSAKRIENPWISHETL